MNLPTPSHRVQLVATALAASIATASALTAFNAYKKRGKRRDLNEQILESLAASDIIPKNISLVSPEDSADSASFVKNTPYDEELIREQLARNYAFFGDEGMDKIRKGTVVVVGCGGVGSWAAVMLLRSGVSNIRLVDFDYVTLSSLNRHATAGLADVGIPKVKSVERALKDIARWANVDARVDIWRKEEGGKLLEGADWVVDAIDNITTKVDLLAYCHSNGIKVFSSTGASTKCDPTRIQISDISSTIYDPLARAVRRRLRLAPHNITSGIPVVYSTEVPSDVKLLPLAQEEFTKGEVKELGVFDDFRVRILPVLGPLPAIFGLNIATYIICELAGKPILNPLPIKNRKKLYERLWRELKDRESKIQGIMINRLPISEDDIGLILEDLHRGGRSVIPPHNVPTKPTLVRWDPSKPICLENVVVMDTADAAKHLIECEMPPEGTPRKTPEEVWGADVQSVIERRVGEVEGWKEWVM